MIFINNPMILIQGYNMIVAVGIFNSDDISFAAVPWK